MVSRILIVAVVALFGLVSAEKLSAVIPCTRGSKFHFPLYGKDFGLNDGILVRLWNSHFETSENYALP